MPINITVTNRHNLFPKIEIEIINPCRTIYQADTYAELKNILEVIKEHYSREILKDLLAQIDYAPLLSNLEISEMQDLYQLIVNARSFEYDDSGRKFYEIDNNQERSDKLVLIMQNIIKWEKIKADRIIGRQHVKEPIVSRVPTCKPF